MADYTFYGDFPVARTWRSVLSIHTVDYDTYVLASASLAVESDLYYIDPPISQNSITASASISGYISDTGVLDNADGEKFFVPKSSSSGWTSRTIVSTSSARIEKTASAQTINVSGSATFNGTWKYYIGGSSTSVSARTSSVSGSFTVPALASRTITYNANGGINTPAPQTDLITIPIVITNDIPTREDYKFAGWGSSATTNVINYRPGSTYTLKSSKTLYAVWIGKKTITYDANGGENGPDPQIAFMDESIQITSDQPTRANYKFIGWSTTRDGSVAYSAGDSYSTRADITLYAVWLGKKYINYVGRGTNPQPQSAFLDEPIVITSEPATLRGYKFIGWRVIDDDTAPVDYYGGETYDKPSSLNLYGAFLFGHGSEITSVKSQRIDFEGNLQDEGVYIKVSGTFLLKGALGYTAKLQIFSGDSKLYEEQFVKPEDVDVIEYSFTCNLTDVEFSIEDTHEIKVIVTDDYPATSVYNDYVSPGFFTIDIKNGGKEIVFGGPANDEDLPENGLFRCDMDFNFTGNIFRNGVEFNGDISQEEHDDLIEKIDEMEKQAEPITYETLKTYLLELAYPVGSIYTSEQNVSPETFLGGTWEPIRGRFLLSENDTYRPGDTGGETSHTLSVAEMPSHNHSQDAHSHTPNASGYYFVAATASEANNTRVAYASSGNRYVDGGTSNMGFSHRSGTNAAQPGISYSGSGSAHNNMPPYLSVYMWKRTA